MKTKIIAVFLLMFVMLIANSCRKNDSDEPSSNVSNSLGSYTFNGKTYQFAKAEYFNPADNTMFIFLRTTEIHGDVTFIFEKPYNQTITEVPLGNYTLSHNIQGLTFADGNLANTADLPMGHEMGEGSTVSIIKESTKYKINFSAKIGSQTITGNYTGPLTEF